MVSSNAILSRLPQYVDEWELIKQDQYVPDIIKEVARVHRLFAEYYDCFSDLFYDTDPGVVADSLYEFCREYIRYKEEDVMLQTSALPTGILHRGYGDCKHYALFTAGVIGSLNRLYGCCFRAEFYFVGYGKAEEPYHVYVVVQDSDEDIWVDPTPGSGGMPTLIIPKPV